MDIYFTKIREQEPFYTPTKREGDADYDLFASQIVSIQPGQIVPVSTNIKIEFPDFYEGKIEEKSGLALKNGIHVLGGVIDCSYTGEIVVILKNQGLNQVFFEAGHKIAQLKIRQVSPHFDFVFVTRPFKQSERKDSGFGSTGV